MFTRPHSKFGPGSILLVLCMLMIAGANARANGAEEHWHILELMGQRAGWQRTATHTDADGNIVTASEFRITIKRGSMETKLSIESGFVESAEHEPMSMSTSMNLGLGMTKTRYVFGEDKMTIESTQGGRTSTRSAALPAGEWLTPEQAGARIVRAIAEGETEFSIRTIDASAGSAPITVEYRVLGREDVEVMGKVVPAIKWEVQTSVMAGVVTVEYVNEKGGVLRSEMNMGGIGIVVIATEKEFAQSRLDAPEMMASTLVDVATPIRRARRTVRGEYVLSLKGGLMPGLPETGAQRVTVLGQSRARIVVDTGAVRAASEEDQQDERYSGPSGMIDSEDPEIIRLSARATRKAGDDTSARAEAMRRFVHRHIDEKSLAVGFASASEVCRAKQGDCTEHGVLLAAMLRADGIPARVVSGLLYVDEWLGEESVFGYHMWTQALLEIDGVVRWVDLDATLGDGTPMDATHIALGVTALADDGVINTLASMAPMIGRLKIEVVRAE